MIWSATVRHWLLAVFAILGQGSRDEGGDDPAPTRSGMGQHDAREVDAAALQAGAKDFRDGGVDALVCARDHQIHVPQAVSDQFAQERDPDPRGLGSAISIPRSLRRYSVFTPTELMTATDAIRPLRLTLR